MTDIFFIVAVSMILVLNWITYYLNVQKEKELRKMYKKVRNLTDYIIAGYIAAEEKQKRAKELTKIYNQMTGKDDSFLDN